MEQWRLSRGVFVCLFVLIIQYCTDTLPRLFLFVCFLLFVVCFVFPVLSRQWKLSPRFFFVVVVFFSFFFFSFFLFFFSPFFRFFFFNSVLSRLGLILCGVKLRLTRHINVKSVVLRVLSRHPTEQWKRSPRVFFRFFLKKILFSFFFLLFSIVQTPQYLD